MGKVRVLFYLRRPQDPGGGLAARLNMVCVGAWSAVRKWGLPAAAALAVLLVLNTSALR